MEQRDHLLLWYIYIYISIYFKRYISIKRHVTNGNDEVILTMILSNNNTRILNPLHQYILTKYVVKQVQLHIIHINWSFLSVHRYCKLIRIPVSMKSKLSHYSQMLVPKLSNECCSHVLQPNTSKQNTRFREKEKYILIKIATKTQSLT